MEVESFNNIGSIIHRVLKAYEKEQGKGIRVSGVVVAGSADGISVS